MSVTPVKIPSASAAPYFGLVLAGGASTRMGRDKAAIAYHGKSQLVWMYDLLRSLCAQVFVSVRPDQRNEPLRAGLPHIADRLEGKGPIAGIHAAQAAHPQAAWLVVACDLPFLNRGMLEYLLANRDPRCVATAYRGSDGLPEPLCTVYEPRSGEALDAYIAGGGVSPREFLLRSAAHLLDLEDRRALQDVDTPQQARAVEDLCPQGARRTLRVQYYAVLRERAGRSEENLATAAATPAALYDELQSRHPFHLPRSRLKVAVNAQFTDWSASLRDGDTVVFIPPVAGG